MSIVKCRSFLNSTSRPNSRLFALAVVTAVALALGGCGRKAGLDLPPGAAAAGDAVPTEATKPGSTAAQSNVFSTANPNDRTQYAPKMPPKRIILDPILD
jgi:predicted small lipoprotein YifL